MGQDDEISISEGIKAAQEAMRKRGGPQVGEVVSHPSDEYTYDFLRVEGDMAIVYIPAENSDTGVEVVKKFPVNELFNVNEASRLTINSSLNSHFKNTGRAN